MGATYGGYAEHAAQIAVGQARLPFVYESVSDAIIHIRNETEGAI